MECGFYYTRAIASWGLLVAMSGFDCNAARGELRFQPVDSTGTVFWSMGGIWGNASFTETDVEILPKFGSMQLKRLSIPRAAQVSRVMLNGTEIPYLIQSDGLEFEQPVDLHADDLLRAEYR